MPEEECRGLAQHRPPSAVVLHCRQQSDVWPNVLLPPFDTRWRARHRRRPSFPWETKLQGTTKSFPWGTKPQGRKERKEEPHPLASAASLTPPQFPLGGKTPRQNSLASAATSAAPASLGGQNPEERQRTSPGGQNPRDKRRPSPAGERGKTPPQLPLG